MRSNRLEKEESLPFVSVIIPCYNDEVGIGATLKSLCGQDYPRDRWELIVVDNNSTDNTFRIAQSFNGRLHSVRVERESRQSSYAARNKGIRVSRGDILAFIDADMTVTSSWIRRGVATIRKGCDYVGCRVVVYPEKPPGNLWELHDVRFGFPIQKYMKEWGFAGAGNIFVRRTVFESVGIFDMRVKSGGDAEFGNRVRDAGFKLCYDHDNAMRHPARSSLRSYWNKKVRVGRGIIDLCHLYPERYAAQTLKSILVQFLPVAPRRIADSSDLSSRRRFGIWVVASCVKFAQAYGQLVRHIQRKTTTEPETR